MHYPNGLDQWRVLVHLLFLVVGMVVPTSKLRNHVPITVMAKVPVKSMAHVIAKKAIVAILATFLVGVAKPLKKKNKPVQLLL